MKNRRRKKKILLKCILGSVGEAAVRIINETGLTAALVQRPTLSNNSPPALGSKCHEGTPISLPSSIICQLEPNYDSDDSIKSVKKRKKRDTPRNADEDAMVAAVAAAAVGLLGFGWFRGFEAAGSLGRNLIIVG